MGGIMRPAPVKKRETSRPPSASWAICSAATLFVRLCVLFIKSPFFAGSFPQRYKVVELALFVIAHLKDQGVKRRPHPSNCPELLRKVNALIQVIGPCEYLLSLLEADPAFGILPQLHALARV